LTSPAWDGNPHIEDLASDFTDAHAPTTDPHGNSCSVFALWLRRWLIGAVAKVLGHKQNVLLTLDGEQGIGKSEFVRWLCSGIGAQYFIEHSINPADKDAFVNLLNYFVWEVGELGATTQWVKPAPLGRIQPMRRMVAAAS
jgi:predicted P-loop ATPase